MTISPSALVNFVSCEHLAALDRAVSLGRLQRPLRYSASAELLRRLGEAHEQAFLQRLEADASVTKIQTDDWAAGADMTLAAMKNGAHVIYQATFVDGEFRGRADFLIRVERPSRLGAHSYEVIDTKLSRSTKVSALLQLCFYSEHVERIQGVPPHAMHVELGGGRGRESFIVAEFSAYYRRIKNDFAKRQPQMELERSRPEPVGRCETCDWYARCDKQWHDEDHLSLVPGIRRSHREELQARGITTVRALSESSPVDALVSQARVLIAGRDQGKMLFELADPAGFALLAAPNAGDVFFDIEADPYVENDGLEYLLGYSTVDGAYHTHWAFSLAEEKIAFEAFVDAIEDRRKTFPDLRIYHYANYEKAALTRLAGRHNTRVDIVSNWLKAGVLIDLYQVVRRTIRASVESYSIKKLEPLYDFSRSVALRDANESLVAFETWLALGGAQSNERDILDTIAGYNQDDCVSAHRLRDWLEARRTESAPDAQRATLASLETDEDTAQQDAETAQIENDLRAMNDDRATLLSHLVDFHRRDAKPMWNEYFRLLSMTDEELLDEGQALSGLRFHSAQPMQKKSQVTRYSFPPQRHKFDVEKGAVDPRTKSGAGEIVALDDDASTIDLKWKDARPEPQALVLLDFFDPIPVKKSLRVFARDVISHGIGGDGCARALLRRDAPRLTGGNQLQAQQGESATTRACRLVTLLDRSVLPIQGPPGTGKTYTGAQMVLALLREGKRVGVTANTHEVIANFLREVAIEAAKAGEPVSLARKDRNPSIHGERVTKATADELHDELRAGTLQVLGGTAWLWAEADMKDAVDVLFIDEASQYSLANAIAVAQSCKSLVLIGDPQQLEQPVRGSHPEGAASSALGHILDGATLSDDRGIFLAETRRMHPSICTFISDVFYESRLTPHAGNAQQCLRGSAKPTGLHFVPVNHEGNESKSMEEVRVVRALIDELLTQQWTNEKGETRALTLEDLRVVSPYNAQVSLLRRHLPEGTRIGTVDKFQGQTCAVCIYSMATSTAAEAPRGMSFLFSGNRLNVALSRARCVSILVASPRLFDVETRTPAQMKLANAFCRFLELAT